MFYIEKLSRLSKRDITAMHIGPALLVFAAFLGITFWNWLQLNNTLDNTKAQILNNNVESTRDGANRRIGAYQDILSTGAGLFNASDYVSREEWKKFTSIFDLSARYPGINTLGVVRVIDDKNLKADTDAIKQNEDSGFHLRPAAKKASYAPVIYSEPAGRNSQPAGFDMYSNDQMRPVMEQARDSGETAITARLNGEQKNPFGAQPAIVMFTPVYTQDSPLGSVNDRRKHIWGYIYAEILPYKLFGQFYTSTNQNFGFRIYEPGDSGKAGSNIYQTPNFSLLDSKDSKQTLDRQFGVNNRRWEIIGIAGPDIVSPVERNRPSNALWGGIFFSIFLAAFIYTLLLNRSRALSNKEDRDIKLAKDELLALASHQLRTPATGVKQYVGMLREGYSGKLTREQKKFLDQAHASNERQLQIINDMLFVARADNGDIEFKFERFDLLGFIKDILAEQQQAIKDKRQKLTRKLPKEPVYIRGDSRYLRMAVENLLSNANKYTPEGGAITVRLKKTKAQAVISVEDNGVGVKDKYYHLLFRKFSRVPNELSNKISGSGIGLYLAKKVVDAHRGKIKFESIPDGGSICTITLPSRKIIRGKR